MKFLELFQTTIFSETLTERLWVITSPCMFNIKKCKMHKGSIRKTTTSLASWSHSGRSTLPLHRPPNQHDTNQKIKLLFLTICTLQLLAVYCIYDLLLDIAYVVNIYIYICILLVHQPLDPIYCTIVLSRDLASLKIRNKRNKRILDSRSWLFRGGCESWDPISV